MVTHRNETTTANGSILFVKIRYFLDAGKHLNFGAAGAELQVTRLALSGTILRLEDGLGVILFERVATGVTLTRCTRESGAPDRIHNRQDRSDQDRGRRSTTGRCRTHVTESMHAVGSVTPYRLRRGSMNG